MGGFPALAFAEGRIDNDVERVLGDEGDELKMEEVERQRRQQQL